MTAYDWQYVSEPQEHTMKDLKGYRAIWPRGKELGGTSMMNTMLYMRGHRWIALMVVLELH
jgi:choline dehydrogenase-like flavoprotein